MVQSLSGLQWKKTDLHIHTPGSLEDRVNKSVGPTDIIARAQELQLDAICVSEHNTRTSLRIGAYKQDGKGWSDQKG